MPSSLRCAATALGLLAAVAAPAIGTGASPAAAQAVLDFGQPGADETLEGGSWPRGPLPVQSSPRSYDAAPAYHPQRGERGLHYLPRSVISYVHSSPSVSRARSTYYRGTGIYANANPTAGSIVVVVPEGMTTSGFPATGPKFIDVEAERLDHQPIPADGISTHYIGSSKIIRIASNYRASDAHRRTAALPAEEPVPPQQPEAETPERSAPQAERAAPEAETPQPEPEAAASDGFEPWTDEWLRDCVSRYENFDASLGTYTDDTGRRRFCTGDPA